jgi:predicted GNAT family acetyltransferase
MYKLADESNIEELLSYFEQDLTNCLYSYIDLKKYGITNEDLNIYYYKEYEQITAVATSYYNGLQLFHFHSDFPVIETAELIRQLNPTIVSSTTSVIDLLSNEFQKGYVVEKGFVTSLSKVLHPYDKTCVTRATYGDLDEIAELICSDEGLGGHYSVYQLREQLLTRMEEDFGRNYIIREHGKIVCHAATYAEVDNLAVISGVITHPEYRGKGLALDLVSKLCMDLLAEGKQPHLFYYTEGSKRLYQKIGFEAPRKWGKLAKH